MVWQAVMRRLETVETEQSASKGPLERLAAVGLNWKPKPFQGTLFSAVAGLDALIWQLTASVAMPGFTINSIVTLTDILIGEYGPTEGIAAQVGTKP